MQREKRLDVLINGAGYGLYGTLEEVSLTQARHEFAVNVFGLAAMTQQVLPLMRAQRSGRIINLSSVAGKVSTPLAGWYAASKHAVEALSDALRLEVAHVGIQVVLIEPGAIKTEFDGVALDSLDAVQRPEEYRTLAASFTQLLRNSYQRASGPAVVARVIGQAVAARHPRARYALPLDSRAFIALKRWARETNLDRILLSQMRV
ncbi:MAG: SDR family NAD(P)-dependent oxidoreductase [Ktedonobacterales bacterium]|nr:SDR family NAD(P)-dependent oxidoreductase [Ktedonobacterales bacterium]